MKTSSNPELEVMCRMKEARYSQLSPRDFFPENVRKEHILAPYEVPKWLYYLDRSKEVALEKLEDGIKATDLRVPKTEDQFLNSIDHHRKHNHSSIYLTLFGAYEEVLHWAKSHAKNAKSECQIWRIDGERLRDYKYTILNLKHVSKVGGPESEYLILHAIPNEALVGGQRVPPSLAVSASEIESSHGEKSDAKQESPRDITGTDDLLSFRLPKENRAYTSHVSLVGGQKTEAFYN